VLSAAEELKYVSGIKAAIGEQFNQPSEEFVRLLAASVYDRPMTAKMREFFRGVVANACKQWVTDQVNARLKTALQGHGVAVSVTSDESEAEVQAEVGTPTRGEDIETTIEEVEGYNIVRAIAVSEVPVERIVARDTKSYYGVLLDDNNRKPICRLHFNRQQKYIGLLDEAKAEQRIPLERVSDIYQHAEQIRDAVPLQIAAHSVRGR